MGYLRQEVPVGHRDFGQIVACECKLQEQQLVRRRQSQLHGWLEEATFDNYREFAGNEAGLREARAFARQPTGWLTFWGPFGNGKTHLLSAVVNNCLSRGIQAIYYTAAEILDRLRAGYGDDDYLPFLEHLKGLEVLVVDELDKVRWTPWACEKIHQLADERYRRIQTLGTVWAMNDNPRLALAEGEYPQLGHVYSRMGDEHCRIVHVASPDVRPHSKSLWASFSDPGSGDEPEADPLPEAA